VRIVRVRIDEADGERVDGLTLERVGDAFERSRIERRHDFALCAHALRHFEAQPPRHERIGFAKAHVVGPWRTKPAELEHVAEALRRHERHSHALALDDRVGRNRGCVHEFADVGPAHAELAQEVVKSRFDRRAVVGGRREQFFAVDGAAARNEGDVGERAADVHAHPVLLPCRQNATSYELVTVTDEPSINESSRAPRASAWPEGAESTANH
jgi:hypothetical protein